MAAHAAGSAQAEGDGAEVGIVSDTHGLLRPGVLPLLEGCDLILHAGDVGEAHILEALQEIAPVVAVRGNTDRGAFGASLPLTEVVHVAGRTLYLIHIVDDLDLDPAAADIDAVIFGHTHRPLVEERGEVLFVNPGSCGPRRFDHPVTVARMSLGPEGTAVRLVPVPSDPEAQS